MTFSHLIQPFVVLFFRDSLLLSAFVLFETVIVRYILNIEQDSPAFLITVFSVATKNRFGQMLLSIREETKVSSTRRRSRNDPNKFHVVNLQGTPDTAENGNNEDDGANLVDVSAVGGRKQWLLLGRFIDRICFVLCTLAYSILILFYLPK